MLITESGGYLQFSQSLYGRLEIKRLNFGNKPSDLIHIADVYLGQTSVMLPDDLEPGPYWVYLEGRSINGDETVFLGHKPTVNAVVEKYLQFDNEHTFRHQISFDKLNVLPGVDFQLFCGKRKVQLHSRNRNTSFDFLIREERIQIELSEELKKFIDTPRGI